MASLAALRLFSAALASHPGLPHWPAQPPCTRSASPSFSDPRAVSSSEEKFSDSFPQSGRLVRQSVFSTATHSTILHMLAVPGTVQSQRWGQPWDTV